MEGQPPVRRQMTLSRQQRSKTIRKLVGNTSTEPQEDKKSLWVTFSKIVTCCFPGSCLSWGGIDTSGKRQAWREKVALCFIIALICAGVFFITFKLPSTLCSAEDRASYNEVAQAKNSPDVVDVKGKLYRRNPTFDKILSSNNAPAGYNDVSNFYLDDSLLKKDCGNLQSVVATLPLTCEAKKTCLTNNDIAGLASTGNAIFEWPELQMRAGTLAILDGSVLDFTQFINNPKAVASTDPLDKIIVSALTAKAPKQDLTRSFLNNKIFQQSIPCVRAKYEIGKISKQTKLCFFSDVLFQILLVIILLILFTKFAMAVVFSWILSKKLARSPKKEKGIMYQPATYPPSQRPIPPYSESSIESAPIGKSNNHELYTVMLVTCYSEGEEGLRCTMDSLASTSYDDSKKLLFVVADGIVTGAGNSKSTPDILIDIIDEDKSWGDAKPFSYLAVAAGKKRHNMARVHIGFYTCKGHRVPTVLVIKCGTKEEENDAKPGNRGKRDAQIILMSFFKNVFLNERMSPLEYELFRKIHYLTGVTPDYYETVLMVDADTKVLPDAVTHLTNAVINDTEIMGLCGETRIANKYTNFTTWIQVYEYYISHHSGKTFESVFGGVTCLPGCFCMYRLKAPAKDPGRWTTILTHPDIIDEYSQGVVETLHEKNLLLLGEDRFLTTLMIRKFPKHKMMFVPQAMCKTIVPDEFKVLLSQRRRWINSTIHNLMELMLVRNLCGTFCCSMQFVIFMELIGTVSLPIAIVMTYILIIWQIISAVKKTGAQSISDYMPLILLVLIIFLPAFLILLTTRKLVYVMWMLIYLVGLPVWNFILPVYAYWHFDDFSWGETRQVAGAKSKDDHGEGNGSFDHSKVPLKRWADYELAWRRYIKKQQTRLASSVSQTEPISKTGEESSETLYVQSQGDAVDSISVLEDQTANSNTSSASSIHCEEDPSNSNVSHVSRNPIPNRNENDSTSVPTPPPRPNRPNRN